MNYSVITSFNEEGLKQYGQRMIDTFESLWPAEVDLVVCAENCRPTTTRSNTRVHDLLAVSPNLRAFIERHRNNPLAHGLAGPPEVFDPRKTFRWNAVRFAYKVYSVALCAGQLSSGWMIWLDADTHTHGPVPIDWLPTVCPSDAMISYLGRGEKYHSECGWVAYNLDHPETRNFIRDFVGMYNTDEIFKLAEWHDSYVWDQVRRRYQGNNKFCNLNPGSNKKGAGHPFIHSALGLYMDHAKGTRKQQGVSRAHEIPHHHAVPYWQEMSKG